MKKIKPCGGCGAALSVKKNWSQSLKNSRCYYCKPCYARRRRPNAVRRIGESSEHVCLDCDARLVAGINWSDRDRTNYLNVCRVCSSARGRAWHERKVGRKLGRRGDAVRGKQQAASHIEKRNKSTSASLAASPIVCAECDQLFARARPAQKYCSGQCWNAAHRRTKNLAAENMVQPRLRVSRSGYEALISIYGSQCGICGGVSGSKKGGRFAIDHCHVNGNIRGLLCHRCNTAIGLLGDDPARIKAAAAYLEQAAQQASEI